MDYENMADIVDDKKNVERLRIKDKEIILVGTAHISNESIKLVDFIINEEKPDTVGVELCQKRYDSLLEKQKWEETKIVKIIKEGKSQLFLANLLLAVFQKRIGKNLKVKPGEEMIHAVKAGEKLSARIVLLDRDIQITLKRAWKEMKFFEKIKLLLTLIMGLIYPEEIKEDFVEKIKEKDVMTQMMEELGKEIPSAKRVLIDERDIYIANKILASPGKKIVVVVGAGHIEGIKKYLYEEKPIASLEEVPPGARWMKYIAYAVPIAFIGIIIWGFAHHKSVELTITMLLYWFLINGVLAALGALLALGHPLTILTAFAAAPFTSLNPTIGAGIVAAIVEAKIREPRVKDFQDISEITTFRGFYKNRVSRILLVAMLANIGSSIGTLIALPYLANLI